MSTASDDERDHDRRLIDYYLERTGWSSREYRPGGRIETMRERYPQLLREEPALVAVLARIEAAERAFDTMIQEIIARHAGERDD